MKRFRHAQHSDGKKKHKLHTAKIWRMQSIHAKEGEREREREMRKEKGEREGWCFSEFSNCVCFCLLSLSRPPSLSLALSLSHTKTIFLDVSARTIIEHKKTFSHTLSLFHHTALTSPTSSPLSLAVAGRGGLMYVCGTNSPLLHSSSRPTLPSPLPEQALHVASSSSSWCCLIFHNSQQQQEQPLEKEAKDRPSWSSSRLCCWLSSSPSKLDPEVGRLIQYRLYFYTWIHDLDRLWVVNWIVERGKEIWKVFVLLFSFRRWLETFWVKKNRFFDLGPVRKISFKVLWQLKFRELQKVWF